MGKIKVYTDNTADWDVVGESFVPYFKRLKLSGCHVVWEHEIYVFSYEDMKFRNEDNWEVEGE